MEISDFTVEGLERALRAASESLDSNLVMPWKLPKPIAFCAEPLLWQIIITMARRFPGDFFVRLMGLDQQSPTFEETKRLALGQPHNVYALALGRVVDEQGIELDETAPRSFNKYLEAMNDQDFLRTASDVEARANLICVQNERRNEVEYLRSLYERRKDNSWIVRPAGDVRLVTQGILADLYPRWSGKTLRDIGTPLSELIRELFENSDWWARSDEKNVPYAHGVRAVSFRIVTIDERNADFFAGENSRLHPYISQHILAAKGEPLEFLELSVVDSGPGLARRWLGGERKALVDLNEVPLDEEDMVVAKCFSKWRTTANVNLRGIGLFKAAQMVKARNGFMRVRTGRKAYLFGTHSSFRDVEAAVRKIPDPNLKDGERLSNGTLVMFDNDGRVAFFLEPWSDEPVSSTFGSSFSVLLPVR